jgi:hypothetical protein
MAKEPVSVTLAAENLLWLRGRTRAARRRSLSETLDLLVTEARRSRGLKDGASRSVVGTIDIDAADPDLAGADAYVRGLFDASTGRPFLVREEPTPYGVARKRKPRRAPKRRA